MGNGVTLFGFRLEFDRAELCRDTQSPTGKVVAANCHPPREPSIPYKRNLQGGGMTHALAATMWVVLVSDRHRYLGIVVLEELLEETTNT